MKKEILENRDEEKSLLEENQVEDDKEGSFQVQKNKASLRRKSGSCGFRTIGKAVVSFFIFVVILGGIGFFVLWILENERVWNGEKENRPTVQEVIKKTDEKISLMKEETAGQLDESIAVSESKEDKNKRSNPSQLPILVLNAGGASGSAGKVTGVLTQAGYTLAKAGNATVFTYKGVTVYYGEDVLKVDAEKVAEILKEKYSSVTVVKAGSSDEKKEKIVVMVGA